MSPEAVDYVRQAREHLAEARRIAAMPIARVAARSAYYAAFHAAEAYIFQQTGKIAKTHSGVRAELARLLVRTPEGGKDLTGFLAAAYKFKEIGDYGVGGTVITEQDALETIDGAARFIARIEAPMIN